MTVTFVLLAFNEKFDYLVSLGSLMCQTNPNWKAIVFHNGPNRQLKLDVDFGFTDERISYVQSSENDGTDTFNRQFAYDNLVDTEFVVSSSIQDYYFPKTVDLILDVAKENDFIYWNSINHLWLDNEKLDAYPKVRSIDWGNFAIRTSLAKEVGIKHHRSATADGLFVEDVMETNPRVCKIHRILTVHN